MSRTTDRFAAHRPELETRAIGPDNSRRRALAAAGLASVLLVFGGGLSSSALADEGGVSFWLPGLYGSLAAVPSQPGFSFANIYYHTSVRAGGNVALARQFQIGRFNPTLTVDVNARLKARADLDFGIGSYVFESPVLGGQAAIGLGAIYARSTATLNTAVFASLGPFSVFRAASFTDTTYGFGDLYPQASIKWNRGVHNFMWYVTGDIPVGAYESTRLANVGIGHAAIDSGGGYTYFNPETGHEFSAVAGFTYNWTNPSTDYKNGIDFHLDWGASQFLSKQFMLGAVGYVYQQLTGDSGSGDRVGAFESRVMGIGPQVGFLFPVGDGLQGYLNLKGYKEFNAENRPHGWNAWVTLSFSPAQQTPSSAQRRPIVTK
jgi:hypothetical protein